MKELEHETCARKDGQEKGEATPFNNAYRRILQSPRLTVGVFFAIESYSGDTPKMEGQVELAQRAEALGYDALWFRDVPLRDPRFGDVGQIYDPWVYLGYIAAQTESIALATGSVVFPLRHPIDLAKAAASVDQLSAGRLILGVASGDRPIEFPAFGKDFAERGETFRETISYFRALISQQFPLVSSSLGYLDGADMIPKPTAKFIPLLVTGRSQQTMTWIARNADGWLMYPQAPERQMLVVQAWRDALSEAGCDAKPFAQSLYIDLTEDPNADRRPIHLGYQLGRNHLISLLGELESIGVNHVALNLKYGTRPANDVLDEIGQEVLPLFNRRSEAL